ncbi:mycothiol transferase [Terrabacter sp. RAF57]|uniref:mycothiol transferase n=1 Tax=Terrabacter sp. RAF57 TaxID=3233063 RepID=UPI003F9C37A5
MRGWCRRCSPIARRCCGSSTACRTTTSADRSPRRAPTSSDSSSTSPTSSSDTDLYRAAWRHGEDTTALGLDTMGRVPHWPEERAHVDVRFVLGHLVAETARHAGHADILREQLDGAVGRFRDRDNMPGVDAAWWAAYLTRVQAAADAHR